MTLNEFRTRVELKRPSNQRRGQYAMNILRDEYPLAYEVITGSDIDPFYNDSRMPAFFAWCAENPFKQG